MDPPWHSRICSATLTGLVHLRQVSATLETASAFTFLNTWLINMSRSVETCIPCASGRSLQHVLGQRYQRTSHACETCPVIETTVQIVHTLMELEVCRNGCTGNSFALCIEYLTSWGPQGMHMVTAACQSSGCEIRQASLYASTSVV